MSKISVAENTLVGCVFILKEIKLKFVDKTLAS